MRKLPAHFEPSLFVCLLPGLMWFQMPGVAKWKSLSFRSDFDTLSLISCLGSWLIPWPAIMITAHRVPLAHEPG